MGRTYLVLTVGVGFGAINTGNNLLYLLLGLMLSTIVTSGVLSERVEGALYEWREQAGAVRVDGDPDERLAAVLALAAGLREARRTSEAAA